MKRLTSVQRIAALCITRAMKITATDLLEVHANLLPIPLLLQNTCYRAIVQISTHPSTHPLHGLVHRAVNQYVASHHTSLHRFTCQYAIIPQEIETLLPARRPPYSSNYFKSHIASSKEDPIKEHAQIVDEIQVYSDRSRYKGRIGAAAVLF